MVVSAATYLADGIDIHYNGASRNLPATYCASTMSGKGREALRIAEDKAGASSL